MKDERCGAPRDGFMSGICRDFRTGISYDRNISLLHEFELGVDHKPLQRSGPAFA